MRQPYVGIGGRVEDWFRIGRQTQTNPNSCAMRRSKIALYRPFTDHVAVQPKLPRNGLQTPAEAIEAMHFVVAGYPPGAACGTAFHIPTRAAVRNAPVVARRTRGGCGPGGRW